MFILFHNSFNLSFVNSIRVVGVYFHHIRSNCPKSGSREPKLVLLSTRAILFGFVIDLGHGTKYRHIETSCASNVRGNVPMSYE